MAKEIWSFIEIENEKLHSTSLKMAAEATRGAKLINGKSCGVLFGSLSCLNQLKDNNKYGLEKIYFFETDEYLSSENIMNNLSSLILDKNPELILFASTATGAEISARMAAKLKKGLVSDCVDFEFKDNKLIARKPLYNGKAHGLFSWCTEPPYLATVNLDSLEAVEADNKVEPEVVGIKRTKMKSNINLTKTWAVPLSELDVTEANLVVGIGNGVDKPEFIVQIQKLAELLGGVLAGTRVAVFKGYIPVDKQIGSTGKFLKGDIYMPIGISGSSRHTSGIKNVPHVIPINTDKEAPIFKFAEIGSLDDLYKVVPYMIDILEKENGSAGDLR